MSQNRENVDTSCQDPKVSILIPTHGRPDYFEIALKSALSQTYQNIEIIISDNSNDTETFRRVEKYLGARNEITYLKTKDTIGLENFYNACKLARGVYVAYLMDDDVFHPDKVSRMVSVFLSNPSVGLVTSYRQLIDSNGNYLPELPSTERLLESDAIISGQFLGSYMLHLGSNVVGEPTTAMVLREDIPHGLGWYRGKQYRFLTDVATWLSILETKDCAYLTDPLSYFRIHNDQDQKKSSDVRLKASLEWFDLAIKAYSDCQFRESKLITKASLTEKLHRLEPILSNLSMYSENFHSLYKEYKGLAALTSALV